MKITPSSLVRAATPARLRPANYLRRLVARRSSGQVMDGIFRGMKYGDAAVGSVFVPKVLGIYERELYPVLERALERGFRTIIDIGAAEGYYAVGLAMRAPTARVIAYESIGEGRRLLAENSALNGVADRVSILGECRLADLAASASEGGPLLIVCDVEGYETTLLDPQAVPGLRSAHILVEMHDFIVADATDLISSRFS